MLPSLCRVGFCEWAQNTRKLTPIYAFIPAHRSGVLHWESPPLSAGQHQKSPCTSALPRSDDCRAPSSSLRLKKLSHIWRKRS